ncbi:hypothetical protein OF83DRAFT_1160133 [Amylostereum chailletii]|nr:hypothetical protein OF83DRAFT_1160133 [Amylostereum chailletii]
MSVFHPVFPPPPRPKRPPASFSSGTTSSEPTKSVAPTYNERLLHRHLAIASVPAVLCPPSPTSSTNKDSVDLLREQIRKAVTAARGQPSSSKWAHVDSLTRLGCARGRWVGVGRRAPKVPAQTEDREWFIAETDEQWAEWEKNPERRRKQGKGEAASAPVDEQGKKDAPPRTQDRIKEKVARWQAEVVPGSVSQPTPVQSQTGRTQQKQNLKRPSPLGFPVVKPSTAVSMKKGKGKGAVTSRFFPTTRDPNIPETPVVNPTPPEPAPMSISPMAPPIAPPAPEAPRIEQVSEIFSPPSFPKELYTSTPPQSKSAKKEKPPPIPVNQDNSLFFASPPTSPVPFPRTQPNNVASSSTSPIRGAKRAREPSPPPEMLSTQALFDRYPAKKPRTAPTPPTSPPPTPSVDKSSWETPPGLGNANGLTTPLLGLGDALGFVAHKTPQKAQGVLATSHRSLPRPRPPSRRSKSGSQRGASEGQPRTPSPSPPKSYFSSPASGDSSEDESTRHRPRSPVSPLFTEHASAFVPPLASTQHQQPFGRPVNGLGGGGGGDGGFAGMGYSSQYDVERNVGHVSEILDRDVDFSIWLRDLPAVEGE